MSDRRFGAAAVLAALALAAPAPRRPSSSSPSPIFRRRRSSRSDPLVGLPLPGATPAEYRAHLLWNLRAGLNVAALQCQFSPYLRTVANYNALLAHHNVELAAAYTTLEGYFSRVRGAQRAAPVRRLFDPDLQ